MQARLEDVERRLREFVGGTAQFWDYRATHGTLVVELVSPEKARSYLLFVMCEEVASSTWWRVTDPRIAAGDGWFEVTDGATRIRCQSLDLHASYRREA